MQQFRPTVGRGCSDRRAMGPPTPSGYLGFCERQDRNSRPEWANLSTGALGPGLDQSIHQSNLFCLVYSGMVWYGMVVWPGLVWSARLSSCQPPLVNRHARVSSPNESWVSCTRTELSDDSRFVDVSKSTERDALDACIKALSGLPTHCFVTSFPSRKACTRPVLI